MEEIEEYLGNVERSIALAKDPVDIAKRKYEYAQLLVSIGKYPESQRYYSEAYKILESLKKDFVWSGFFCSVGLQYANSLDYNGEYEAAGKIFSAIMSIDPIGFHIGDYALYLHRRKREFDKAHQ